MAVSKESTIFPVGTIFVDRGNYLTGLRQHWKPLPKNLRAEPIQVGRSRSLVRS